MRWLVKSGHLRSAQRIWLPHKKSDKGESQLNLLSVGAILVRTSAMHRIQLPLTANPLGGSSGAAGHNAITQPSSRWSSSCCRYVA